MCLLEKAIMQRLVYRNNRLRSPYLHVLLAGMLVLAGCTWTESGFARMASDVGSTFAAAATTLRDVREGALTVAYARSSFAGYRQQVEGLDQQLPQQNGAPDHQVVQRLIALYHPASLAITHPCLEGACDWHGQLAALERASQAFQQAGDS
jgi:hypothetical protein